jgi:hypothetical protein
MEHDEPKKKTPWGVFIGLAIILIMIVIGAFYSFSTRYYPVTHPAAETSTTAQHP